jgi:lactoylglutathione lyase
MTDSEFPAPHEGFVITHFLVVSDQDRSREFYRSVFGATVVLERDPVILKIANSWLILNVGGGPTDDKPTVTLAPPSDPERASAFLNIRVADIAAVYAEWSAKGAEFLTEPKDHAHEIRAYIRDPDGHLIEVGQAKAPPGTPLRRRWICGRRASLLRIGSPGHGGSMERGAGRVPCLRIMPISTAASTWTMPSR